MRFFLLDRITELEPSVRARALKCVTLTDDVLHDHFPDHPTMPGVLILEAGAQLGAFLLEQSQPIAEGLPLRALLTQVDEAKFYDLAGPGDRLELEATIQSTLASAGRVKVQVRNEGRRVARATLTFMMMHIDSLRVHEQRRYIYGLWTRDLQPKPSLR